MIKFFRRIRQDMIKENRASKYMLYAIGEIVLVVIGILIALQINNGNENRKSNKLARSFLTDLQEEINLDVIDLEWNLKEHLKMLKAEKTLLLALKNKDYKLPSDFKYIDALGVDPITAVQNSTIESLKAEGLGIIENKALRKKISRLYDFYFTALLLTENHVESYNFYIRKLDFFAKHFKLSGEESFISMESENDTYYSVTVSTEGIVPKDFKQLRTDEAFKLVLSQSIFYRSVIIKAIYEEALNKIKELDEAITKELNNND